MAVVRGIRSEAASRGFLMLLRDFLRDIYLNRPRVRSVRTKEFYCHEVAKLDSYHGKPVALSELREALVLGSCQSQIGRSRSLATVQKHQTAILAIWRYAYRKRRSIESKVPPVPDMERWPGYQKEPECWTVENVSALLSAALRLPGQVGDCPRCVFWPALILVCYETGVRISAIMAARWEDLGGDGILRFKAETSKDRQEVVSHLSTTTLSFLSQVPRVDATVFGCWPWDRGKGHHWRALNRGLAKLMESAGLEVKPGQRFHGFRRTFATLICSRLGESVAQSMLGHSSLRVTRRYIDKTKIDLPHACDVLPKPQMEKVRICV